MIRSLKRQAPESAVWVLCLSDRCFSFFAQNPEPGVRPIRLSDLEEAYPELTRVKRTRSLVEYYFTCTPVLICYLLEKIPRGEFLTYVDSDTFFFSDPELIFADLTSASVAITPHRFAPKLSHLRKFGDYNVGWLSFRNDTQGFFVADWWMQRCLEWCYDYLDDGRFADQKYLDEFPKLANGVVSIENRGVNLAPWNLGHSALEVRGGRVLVDGQSELVFFHFHGVRIVRNTIFLAEHYPYGAPFNSIVRRYIYRPYVKELACIARDNSEILDTRALARSRGSKSGQLDRLIGNLKRLAKNAVGIILGEFIVVVNGRAF